MKKIALSSLLASASILVPSLALAQDCPPGSWLCAGAQIGGIGGSLVIGGGRPVGPGVVVQPPPPPPPAPPVVVLQPAPVYVPPPPPPAPVMVYQPPQVIYTQTTTYAPAPPPAPRQQAFGLGAFASGLFLGGRDDARSHGAGMGGAGAVMRFRTVPHFAVEATVAGMAGRDYNGDARAEVPVTLGGVLYFNPQNRFQIYGLLGAGASFAAVRYEDPRARGRDDAGYVYLGGYAGLGAEWQLSPRFSLFLDVRGFIRGRVDREAERNPEFSRVNGTTVETTNVSMGMTGNLGAMFYF